MRPRTRLPVALVLLITLAAVTAVPTAEAREPPTPVCGVCSVDTTVDGTHVAGGESELTIQLHENGSTTWVATIELTAGADAMAENDSLRRVVVDEAMGRSIAEPEDVRSGVDGETMTVRYRDAEAAERTVGTVVFTPLTPESPDGLFVAGGEGPRYLGVDRFTLRAPPGYELYGTGDGGRSGELVWTRNGTTERTYLDVTADPVAVDADTWLPGVRVWLARLLS
ncbi:hypothetical protein [Halolamina rubra]|uniref:hypothetical protein n=1 Tax=Halolamina rubra TaxID=1380430 RepID=UPI000679E6D0|nr:hypothetical protein [Halolamina rubra]